MDLKNELRTDAVELGIASDETKGPAGKMVDIGLGQEPVGLSDD